MPINLSAVPSSCIPCLPAIAKHCPGGFLKEEFSFACSFLAFQCNSHQPGSHFLYKRARLGCKLQDEERKTLWVVLNCQKHVTFSLTIQCTCVHHNKSHHAQKSETQVHLISVVVNDRYAFSYHSLSHHCHSSSNAFSTVNRLSYKKRFSLSNVFFRLLTKGINEEQEPILSM